MHDKHGLDQRCHTSYDKSKPTLQTSSMYWQKIRSAYKIDNFLKWTRWCCWLLPKIETYLYFHLKSIGFIECIKFMSNNKKQLENKKFQEKIRAISTKYQKMHTTIKLNRNFSPILYNLFKVLKMAVNLYRE